jgi:hypothetical protein
MSTTIGGVVNVTDNRFVGGKSMFLTEWGTGHLTADSFSIDKPFGGYSIDPVLGPNVSWATGGVAETKCGFQTFYSLTTRKRNPLLFFSFQIQDEFGVGTGNPLINTNLDFFMGYSPSTAAGFNFFDLYNGSDPLNGYSGIGLCLHNNNFEVATNNGADETVYLGYPEPIIPLSGSPYSCLIEAWNENDGFKVTLGPYETFQQDSNTQTMLISIGDVPEEHVELGGANIIINHIAQTINFGLAKWEGLW